MNSALAQNAHPTSSAVNPDLINNSKGKESIFASFLLDNQEFAIRVDKVREAVMFGEKPIRIPASIDIIEGLLNLRGGIIPIINLKRRFRYNTDEYAKDSIIAITKIKNNYFGLLFDNISEVLRLRSDVISSLQFNSENKEVIINGVINIEGGKRVIQIIDPDIIFDKYDLPFIFNEVEENDGNEFRLRKVELIQIITFFIDGQEYAININSIREIIAVPDIHRRVLIDDFIKGAFTLRGELVTLIDLRMFMGLHEKPMEKDSRILILGGDNACGLLVDSISEVVTREKCDVKKIPLMCEKGINNAYEGVITIQNEGCCRNIVLLDSNRLFSPRLKRLIQQNVSLHVESGEQDATRFSRLKTEEVEQEKRETKVYVSFMLNELLGIDILALQEIIPYDKTIASLPGQADSFAGVINLRGDIIPIVNLRTFFDLEPYENIFESKMLILHVNSRRLGLIVDDIDAIVKSEEGKDASKLMVNLGSGQRNKFKHLYHRAIPIETEEGQKMVLTLNVPAFFEAINLENEMAAIKTSERQHAEENAKNEKFVL